MALYRITEERSFDEIYLVEADTEEEAVEKYEDGTEGDDYEYEMNTDSYAVRIKSVERLP